MKILVATRSEGKQRELRRLFAEAGHEAVFPSEAGAPWSGAEELLEVADSFQTNARVKAEYFARKTGLPTVADDSGLEVIALGGKPGTRSKRFAGATGSPLEVDQANNKELLRRLSGLAEAKRRARYRCVLAYLPAPGAVPQMFEGTCNGRILAEPRGEGGFGYDPLFLNDDLDQTFGEADPAAKDTVSHRGRAFRAFLAALQPSS
ncbi:MAG TPA: non-canonical purine NTP pyrophosphatase [Gemmatimonadales bacterium]|nr:non-canonical purine NTP pyrophosphatase [Gemmatimonadales bacterium]